MRTGILDEPSEDERSVSDKNFANLMKQHTLQLEQLVPVADSGTRPKARSESRSLGAEVPLKAIITSLAASSRNRVA